MKFIVSIFVMGATAALSLNSLAQETKPAAPTLRANPSERMVRPERLRAQSGKVLGIDKVARAITVGPLEGVPPISALTSNVVVLVSTNTYIIKNSKRITLDDLAVGDPVQFQLRKTADGKQAAAYVMVRPPTQTRPVAPKAPAETK